MRGPTPEGVETGAAVNLGPVYISTVQAAKGLFRDVSIFGIEVNKTARLAAIARPGEALASAAVLEAASETEARPTPYALRGLPDPVMAAVLA